MGVANAGIGRVSPTIYNDLHSDAPKQSRAFLVAWDPVAGKEMWRVDNPVYGASGTMTTGGDLVFTGDNQGNFYAYNARTGQQLWSAPANASPFERNCNDSIPPGRWTTRCQVAPWSVERYTESNEGALKVMAPTSTVPSR